MAGDPRSLSQCRSVINNLSLKCSRLCGRRQTGPKRAPDVCLLRESQQPPSSGYRSEDPWCDNIELCSRPPVLVTAACYVHFASLTCFEHKMTSQS